MSRSVAILLTVLLWSTAAAAQVEVGNGGDVVLCNGQDGTAQFDGHYSLDYVATFDFGNGNRDIVTLPFEEQLDRIEAQLYTKATTYWLSFREFRQFLFNNNIANPYVWRGHPYGLIKITDENLAHLLPPYCYSRNARDELDVIQAVVRETRPGKVVFNYDPNVTALLRQVPNQLSFLVVHEWLWNFAPNAGVVREINRLLHSDQLEGLSSPALQLIFEEYGLQILNERDRAYMKGHRSILIRQGQDGRPTTGFNEMRLMQRGDYRLDVYNESPNKVQVRYGFIGGIGGLQPEPGRPLAPSVPEYPGTIAFSRSIDVMPLGTSGSTSPSNRIQVVAD